MLLSLGYQLYPPIIIIHVVQYEAGKEYVANLHRSMIRDCIQIEGRHIEHFLIEHESKFFVFYIDSIDFKIHVD